MVRSHTVMVWSDYLPKKSLVVVSGGEWWVGGRPNLMLAQVQVWFSIELKFKSFELDSEVGRLVSCAVNTNVQVYKYTNRDS